MIPILSLPNLFLHSFAIMLTKTSNKLLFYYCTGGDCFLSVKPTPTFSTADITAVERLQIEVCYFLHNNLQTYVCSQESIFAWEFDLLLADKMHFEGFIYRFSTDLFINRYTVSRVTVNIFLR